MDTDSETAPIINRQSATRTVPTDGTDGSLVRSAVKPKWIGAKGLLLSRLLHVCCAMVATATVAAFSGDGHTADQGYYCLYGKYEACSTILALNAVLLVAAVLQLGVLVFRTLTFGSAVSALMCCEVLGVAVSITSFVLQVVLYDGSDDTFIDQTLRCGMAFTMLTLLFGISNVVLMHCTYSSRKDLPPSDGFQLADWIRKALFGLPEVPLFAITAILSIVCLSVVGSFSSESGLTLNGTCLFFVESDLDATCEVVRASCLLSLCIAPLLIMEVQVRRKMRNKRRPLALFVDVGRLFLLFMVASLKFASFALTLRNWNLLLNAGTGRQMNGGQRYGGGSVIAFQFINGLLWLGIGCVWLRRLNAKTPDATDSSAATGAELTNVHCGGGKPGYLWVSVKEWCLLVCSAIVLACLLNTNYDGHRSEGNKSSSCVYAANGAACNFVLATAAISLVYHFLIFFTRLNGCFPARQMLTELTGVLDMVCSVFMVVIWLASGSLQARKMTTTQIEYDKPTRVAAAVFSFFAVAVSGLKVINLFYTGCKAGDGEQGDETQNQTKATSNWTLLILLLTVVGSLTSVVVVVRHGHWPDSSAQDDTCVFHPGAELCPAIVASFGLSTAFSIGLVIYILLAAFQSPRSVVALVASIPMTILSLSMMIIINIQWQEIVSDMAIIPESAHQYNAGYTVAVCSVFVTLGWVALTATWLGHACTNYVTCCTDAHGGVGEQLLQVIPTAEGVTQADGSSIQQPPTPQVVNRSDRTLASVAARTTGTPASEIRYLTKGSWHNKMIWRNRQGRPCPTMEACWKFVVEKLQLNGIRDVFDHRHDRCYCPQCIDQAAQNQELARGEELYLMPADWCRFGLDPLVMIQQYGGSESSLGVMFGNQATYDQGWPVAYHGTFTTKVRSILSEGSLLKPGDRTKAGAVINVVDGHFDARKQPESGRYFDYKRVFLSPSIRYCSCYCAQEPGDPSHMVALQARVHPDEATRGPETLAGEVTEESIGSDRLEWSVRDGKFAPLYGLLVRKAGH